jgi:hypothetical protein
MARETDSEWEGQRATNLAKSVAAEQDPEALRSQRDTLRAELGEVRPRAERGKVLESLLRLLPKLSTRRLKELATKAAIAEATDGRK